MIGSRLNDEWICDGPRSRAGRWEKCNERSIVSLACQNHQAELLKRRDDMSCQVDPRSRQTSGLEYVIMAGILNTAQKGPFYLVKSMAFAWQTQLNTKKKKKKKQVQRGVRILFSFSSFFFFPSLSLWTPSNTDQTSDPFAQGHNYKQTRITGALWSDNTFTKEQK